MALSMGWVGWAPPAAAPEWKSTTTLQVCSVRWPPPSRLSPLALSLLLSQDLGLPPLTLSLPLASLVPSLCAKVSNSAELIPMNF